MAHPGTDKERGVVGLGAALYNAYGLEGLRGPLFDPLIAEMKARQAAEEERRRDPTRHRRGFLDLCDDRDLATRPIEDFLYDPTAKIIVVGTTTEFRARIMSGWRYVVESSDLFKSDPGYFEFRRDSLRTSSGGLMFLMGVQSEAFRGFRAKSIFVHYSIYNNRRGRDLIEYALPPCLNHHTISEEE